MAIAYAKDELKEKIEKARMALSPESRAAIDSVDWQSVIVGMRESKKFSFSQIEALGVATEAILAGLMSGEEYKRELGSKMGLPADDRDKLVAEMNEIVFKKIKENLIERLGTDRAPARVKTLSPEISSEDNAVLQSAGISINKDVEGDMVETKLDKQEDMIAQIENTELIKKMNNPIIEKKLTMPFQIAPVKTEHTVSVEKTEVKKPEIRPVARPTLPHEDPYREPTE